MEDLLKELLEHYNEMIIEMAERVQDCCDREDRYFREKSDLRQKNDEQAKKIEELSRTVTVLQRTLKCHNDYLDDKGVRNDYETFQDKWIEAEKKEEHKNG